MGEGKREGGGGEREKRGREIEGETRREGEFF
jgi:hypothetical protein